MQIKVKPTPRGFLRADFKDGYGLACSLQESSLATKSYIWLGLNEPELKMQTNTGDGWKKVELADHVEAFSRMHLDRATVRELIPLLQRFVDTGRLAPAPEEEGSRG